MSADSGDRNVELEESKARRKLLFELLVEHPSDVRVSLRIDDQIADLTERTEPKRGTKRLYARIM